MTPDRPTAHESERLVNGCILLNREAILAVADWLKPEHFDHEGNRLVYAAALACWHNRIPPDVRTIAEELKRTGNLEAIGGLMALAGLTDSVPTSYHIQFYAQPILEAYHKRQLGSAADRIKALEYRADLTAEQAQAEAVAILTQATAEAQRSGPVHIGDVCTELFNAMSSGTIPGFDTGLHDYNAITGGLQRSDLVVLAARPGVGKTSMALTFAYEMARRGTPILFFSLEMSREQLVQRLVSMHTGVSTHKLRQNQLRHDEIPEVIRAFGEISEWPIYVEDMTDQTPLSIRTATLRHMSKVGESVVMVDYLQLMEGKGRDENRVQEVSKISRGLKKLAKETNMPVLALSQLSRAVEGRTSHVPMLSDLRESGSIEQDADIVLFIYREELYDRESDKRGMAELHIAKHRNGPLGVIPLRFDNSTTRFHDLTYRTPDNY